MPNLTIHPATRLIAWLSLLLAVQCLSDTALAAAFLLLPLLGGRVMRRAGRLVWRSRWLLAALLAVFSWAVAGDPLWNGPLAPSDEGLREACTHLARLLLVLCVVAALLETLPLADLLAATHTLLKPLRYFAFDPDRGVVRLMLVLRYVETLPRPRDWRDLLTAPATSVREVVAVDDHRLRWPDYLLAVGCAAAVLFLCLH